MIIKDLADEIIKSREHLYDIPPCDICKKNPATNYQQFWMNGNYVWLHICEECR
jgi:hypothetical protein